MILAVAAAIGISLWLLKLERQLVSVQVGRSLLTLRLLVLALLLITLLQPVLTRSWDVRLRGRIVVAIDASESMETVDRHATAAEKLRWAQALGMLGNEQTTGLIDEWVRTLEAGQQPDWTSGRPQTELTADKTLAAARRQQIDAAMDEIGKMPRMEFVRRLLQSQPRNLLKQLEETMPLELCVFASELRRVDGLQLQQQLDSARTEVGPGRTDLVELFAGLTAEQASAQLRGIILLSDGRQTARADVASEARRLGSLTIPVFAVPIGSRLPPRDLSIVSVESPESVYVRDTAQIAATIGTAGFEGQDVVVRLEKDGTTMEQQTVTPSSDSSLVRFAIPTSEVGRFDYRVVAATQPGELREDNNARDISLHVVDSKARVTLLEGDARWEFRYLKNLLERDQQTTLETVLFRQPWLRILNDTFINRTLPDAEEFKRTLAETDLLIIGDVPPERLPEPVWALIEAAVQKDGLTLMIVPGRRNMPHNYQSPILNALLPVDNFRQVSAEQFRPSLTDEPQSAFQLLPEGEAASLPMFQAAGDPSQIQEQSGESGHPWAYAGTPRPSATTWAFAELPGNRVVREPAIIHQYYGFGQVLWMGIDSTWRWRSRAGDRLHHQFWGQLVRWAARNKAAAGNDQVRLTLSDSVIDETESVLVTARWVEQILPKLAGATVEAEIFPAEPNGDSKKALPAGAANEPETTRAAKEPGGSTVVLQAASDTPDRFVGKLPRLTPGDWRVRLRVTGGQVVLNGVVATDLLVRPKLSVELANVSCSRDLLQQVASLSGGEMVEPFETDRLRQLITPQDQSEAKLQERTLWDHWLTLLLFFALLTSEWVIRKLNGLP